jgi:hypothetical protein
MHLGKPNPLAHLNPPPQLLRPVQGAPPIRLEGILGLEALADDVGTVLLLQARQRRLWQLPITEGGHEQLLWLTWTSMTELCSFLSLPSSCCASGSLKTRRLVISASISVSSCSTCCRRPHKTTLFSS